VNIAASKLIADDSRYRQLASAIMVWCAHALVFTAVSWTHLFSTWILNVWSKTIRLHALLSLSAGRFVSSTVDSGVCRCINRYLFSGFAAQEAQC